MLLMSLQHPDGHDELCKHSASSKSPQCKISSNPICELSGVIEHPVTQIDDSGDDRCREALPTISRNKVVVKSSQVGEWCRTTNVPVFHEESLVRNNCQDLMPKRIPMKVERAFDRYDDGQLDPTEPWQRCSTRIRAGSDFVAGSRHPTQRAPNATGHRINDVTRLAQHRPAVRGRNLGGAETRSTQGLGYAMATAPNNCRVPVLDGSKSPDPPVYVVKLVQLYERSRLPVPIHPGPPTPRIPQPVRTISSGWEPKVRSVPPPESDSDRTCSFTLTGTIRLSNLPATTDCTTAPPSRQPPHVLSSPTAHDHNTDSSIGSRPSSMDRNPSHKRDSNDLSDFSDLGSLSVDALDLTTTTRSHSRATSIDRCDHEDPNAQ
ncbi:uncharacterized protein LOC112691793 isoform X2 [Sipha flava]|uniref:Uncharacterized protein LOC112691793 isoform X2 n=1 Tax=Sipha flava TaxID=143950 RepID=A0A8B8GHD9_9HEMI|nr:uncharacterized protein LOC112691793 isoform X2 [Sipha flava]